MLSFLTQRIGPLEKLMQILLLHLGQRSYVVARLNENICWSSTEGWETKRERQSEIKKKLREEFPSQFPSHTSSLVILWRNSGSGVPQSKRIFVSWSMSVRKQSLVKRKQKSTARINTRTRQTSSSVMISRLKRERKPLWKDFSSSSDQNQPRPIPSFQEAPRKAFPRAALFWSADRYLAKTDCKWETFEKEDRQSFENICCWLTIGSGEEGLASEHLRHDAANRPSSGVYTNQRSMTWLQYIQLGMISNTNQRSTVWL